MFEKSWCSALQFYVRHPLDTEMKFPSPGEGPSWAACSAEIWIETKRTLGFIVIFLLAEGNRISIVNPGVW